MIAGLLLHLLLGQCDADPARLATPCEDAIGRQLIVSYGETASVSIALKHCRSDLSLATPIVQAPPDPPMQPAPGGPPLWLIILGLAAAAVAGGAIDRALEHSRP